MKTTTLNEIRKHHPCADGWKKLLTSLNKTEADDEPLSFSHILASNGIKDAIWCTRVLHKKDIVSFAADVAESVLHIYESKYPGDNRPRMAIESARQYSSSADAAAYDADAADAAYAAYAYAAADAAYAAYAVYAAYAAADAAYAAAYAASAASAAAYAASAASAAAYAAFSVAKKEKWHEIEQIFVKHFCQSEITITKEKEESIDIRFFIDESDRRI